MLLAEDDQPSRPTLVLLRDLIAANRDRIVERAGERVRARTPSRGPGAELESGIALFLTELIAAWSRYDGAPGAPRTGTFSRQGSTEPSGLPGHDMLRGGFGIAQVVHAYGDVCQVVVDLAEEMNAAIAPEDVQLLNRCLDDAIANAVTAYGQQREQDLADEGAERLGVFAHELRNLLDTAIMSFNVVKKGLVGPGGSTGAVHSRNLSRLNALVERSLAELRLEAGRPKLERMSLLEFFEDVEATAALDIGAFACNLDIVPPSCDATIKVDRQLLASAVSNLLHNALKFTRPDGRVTIVTQLTAQRVLIEVRDQCGGLPRGRTEDLFGLLGATEFNRTQLGLGLSIALRAVHANDGDLRVRDVPGEGCIFTIDLPREVPTCIGI